MKDIRKQTDNLLNIVENSLDWANTLKDVSQKDSLVSAFKSVDRSLSVINNSLKKRPSIAIFGQSQVGKSYLVQNLTKAEDAKFLTIKASSKDQQLNFLTEINPDGGKESTGLVTRFTTKEIDDDPSFPIKLDVFGQLDIASIFLNAFWSDLKDYDESVYEVEQDHIKQLFSDLSTQNKTEGINENDTFFFIKYIEANFRDTTLYHNLRRIGYFRDLEKKLHLIPSSERWRILHFLWGRNKFFTQMFKELSEKIGDLDFQQELRVELAAITPNTTTIIDVERVREVLQADKSNDIVRVKLKNGSIVEILRSYLSILSKEVQLQLSNTFEESSKQSFLNTADILDFPGSKSRERIPLEVFDNNSSEDKLQLFIRGKVSYLFDLYSNQLMVSSLLYCMDDNPPEEKEAPNRLHKWVKMYVGKTPSDRAERLSKTKEILQNVGLNVNNISPLLVVFTKFNQEMNNVIPGEETKIERHDSKWSARFQENFVNFMSRPVDDKWINNWSTEEKNFKFIFPVRDPLYSQATFEGFETEGKETKIRQERENAMSTMRTSFTNSEVVNNHTISSEKIWSELSSPNGTGLSYLCEHLKNSSHEYVTITRLQLELNRIQKELLGVLKPYQLSGDLETDLRNANVNSLKVYTALVSIANRDDNTMNKILSAMIISDTEIWNLLYAHVFGKTDNEVKEELNLETNLIESLNDLGISITPDISLDDIWNSFRDLYQGMSDEDINNIIIEMFSVDINDIPKLISTNNDVESEHKLAEMVITYYIDRLMHISLNNNVFDNLNESQKQAFQSLISEIIKGKERFELRKVISNTIKDIKVGAISVEDIDLVASCCTTILNKYFFSSCWIFSDEESKPKYNGDAIFSVYGKDYDSGDLDYSSNTNKIFIKEWSLGSRELFKENILFEHNTNQSVYDIESNNKLNAIIDDLNQMILTE